MKQDNRGGGALLLAAVLCSLGGVCIKYIPWTPLAINGARCAIAACVTAVYLCRTKHRLRHGLTVWCGAFSLALTTVLYVCATKLTSAACAILLMYTAPVWVMLYLWLVRGRRPAPKAALAVGGVVLGLGFFVADGLANGRWMGNVLGFLSGITYAGVFLFGADEEGDGFSSYFFGQIIGAAVGLPTLLTEREFSAMALLCVSVLGVFQLGLSYLLMAWGLARTPALAASLITALEPILTPVWVALFYGERPTATALCGIVLVLLCVAWYNAVCAKGAA